MTSSADPPAPAQAYAVDTSVAIAALDAGHSAHRPCLEAVRQHRPALAGHAAFEVYSVLTRMPGALAVDAADASALLDRVFPALVALPADASEALRRTLPVVGITGGAVYDALVGSAARANGCHLLTRDQRARRTYDLLGVDYTFVGL